jgi:hypothetical protein
MPTKKAVKKMTKGQMKKTKGGLAVEIGRGKEPKRMMEEGRLGRKAT